MAVRSVIVATLIGVFSWSTNAEACSCRKLSFEEKLEGVDVAFRARVISTGEGPMSDEICRSPDPPAAPAAGEILGDICEVDPEACPPQRLASVSMEVLETVKGPQLQQAHVISCLPGCGEPFDSAQPPAPGTEYIIFGWQRDGYVESAACRSTLIRENQEAVDGTTGRGCAGCVVGRRAPDASALPLAALLVLTSWRRRRGASVRIGA